MKFIHIIICLTLIAAISVIILLLTRHDQTPATSLTPESSKIEKEISANHNEGIIINPSGWLVPDISKLKKTEPRFKWKSESHSVNIYATDYETGGLELPVMNTDGSIDPINKVAVRHLTVFDIDNRAFCYRMLFWYIPPKGLQGVGVVFYHTYYDMDGDGKFESWDTKNNPAKSLKMPKWLNP
jgi:hypothetical protein